MQTTHYPFYACPNMTSFDKSTLGKLFILIFSQSEGIKFQFQQLADISVTYIQYK